jgi:hypothetical protein
MTAVAIIWMLALALGLASSLFSVGSENVTGHFVTSLLFAGFMVVMGIRDRRIAMTEGMNNNALAAQAMRTIGFVWSWAAVVVVLPYMALIDWPRWSVLASVLVALAGGCLFWASVLDRDAAENSDDPAPARLAHLAIKSALAVTCALFGCLLAAGRASPEAFGGEAKWVAVNVLMSTAVTLAVYCAYVISTQPEDSAPATAR